MKPPGSVDSFELFTGGAFCQAPYSARKAITSARTERNRRQRANKKKNKLAREKRLAEAASRTTTTTATVAEPFDKFWYLKDKFYRDHVRSEHSSDLEFADA